MKKKLEPAKFSLKPGFYGVRTKRRKSPKGLKVKFLKKTNVIPFMVL